MSSVDFNFPSEDYCVHIKILNKLRCFSAVNLPYVSLIFSPLPPKHKREKEVFPPLQTTVRNTGCSSTTIIIIGN